jgi:hypothetical protein
MCCVECKWPSQFCLAARFLAGQGRRDNQNRTLRVKTCAGSLHKPIHHTILQLDK